MESKSRLPISEFSCYHCRILDKWMYAINSLSCFILQILKPFSFYTFPHSNLIFLFYSPLPILFSFPILTPSSHSIFFSNSYLLFPFYFLSQLNLTFPFYCPLPILFSFPILISPSHPFFFSHSNLLFLF